MRRAGWQRPCRFGASAIPQQEPKLNWARCVRRANPVHSVVVSPAQREMERERSSASKLFRPFGSGIFKGIRGLPIRCVWGRARKASLRAQSSVSSPPKYIPRHWVGGMTMCYHPPASQIRTGGITAYWLLHSIASVKSGHRDMDEECGGRGIHDRR